MNDEHDFLLGMLAVEEGLVDASQFVKACAESKAQAGCTVPDIFVSRRWITSEQRDELKRVLERRIGECNGAVRSVYEALAKSSADDDERSETLIPVRDNQDYSLETVIYSTPPEQRSRYSLTRVHGMGGLGRVWLARDTSLNREVALKEIRPDREIDDHTRQRLVREAQITGQLEHPNIIPVYELVEAGAGDSQENHPFYTMRFMRGQTLSEQITRYYERCKSGTADAMEFRQLLNSFVSVCQAISYAGSKGIVHRDLKPDNVMLGDFGEVVVLDWGLAKSINEPFRDGLSDRDAKHESVETTGTLPGQIMGSLPYMAPEQADGRSDLIDKRTDIYGLGAILFKIITEHAPHKAPEKSTSVRDTIEFLRRIVSDPTPQAHSINSKIPAALNAICAKAMAGDQDERYQDAAAIADDVLRWLADEPVSVFREPWHEQLARWFRRHKNAALALLLISGISVVAAVAVESARRQKVAALEQTERALASEGRALAAEKSTRVEATQRLRDARGAIDTWLTGSSHLLQYFPGTEFVITKLLERAAEDYAKLASENSDDPELRLETGRALLRLGDVYRTLNVDAEARSSYDRALALFKDLSELSGKDGVQRTSRSELARCHTRLGVLSAAKGAHAEAERDFDAAADVLRQLTRAEDADDAGALRRELAEVVALQADVYRRTGRGDEALAAIERVDRDLRAAASESRELLDVESLARIGRLHGELLSERGRGDDAESRLRDSIAAYNDLYRAHPDELRYLEGLNECRLTLANALLLNGDLAQVEGIYRDAISEFQIFAVVRPGIPWVIENQAIAQTNLAQLQHQIGKNADAENVSVEALRAFMKLVDLYPDFPRYHHEEAVCRTTLGQALHDMEKNVLALTAFKSAVEKCEQLQEEFPGDARFQRTRAECESVLGQLHHQQGAYAMATEAYTNANSFFEKALQSDQNDAIARNGLAWTCTYLGDMLYEQGKKESEIWYQRALNERGKLAQTPQHLYNHAWLLTNCQDPQFRDPGEAVRLARDAVSRLPKNGRYWTMLGAAHVREGEFAKGLEALSKARSLPLHEKDTTDFWLAMAYHHLKMPDKAIEAFEQGVTRMKRIAPGNRKLAVRREEAARLMGLSEAKPPNQDSAPPP